MIGHLYHNDLTWWFDLSYPYEALGFLPEFLSARSMRSVREQFDANYRFGGWDPFPGFTFDAEKRTLKFPGDPVMTPIAGTTLRDEKVFVYPHSWVLVLQKDGWWECAKLD